MRLTSNDDDTLRFSPIQTSDALVVVTDWAGKSSVGHVRSHNEDSWGQTDERLFVVADGIGGSAGGERASALAVAGFLSASPADGWVQAIQSLNDMVRSECTNDGFPEAGTTLVGLIVEPARCTTVSIGDSRIYRRREAVTEVLTVDHNLRTLRAEEGLRPDADDARGRPAALTSFLGNTDDNQRIDVGTIQIIADDRVLLCSDGIHDQLSMVEIDAALGLASCAETAEALVARADAAGGRDNATAIVLQLNLVTADDEAEQDQEESR